MVMQTWAISCGAFVLDGATGVPQTHKKKLTTNKSNVSSKFYSKDLDCMVRESLSKETVFKIRSKWQEGLSHEENGGGRAKVL